MTIASKALNKSKQNLGSGCYNIEYWLHYFPPISIFQSHVLCTLLECQQFSGPVYAVFVEYFTKRIEDLSFFFQIIQRLKCKTYSIDKEETNNDTKIFQL